MKRRRLCFSIFFSLSLHGLAFLFLYYSSWVSIQPTERNGIAFEPLSKEEILKETFSSFSQMNQKASSLESPSKILDTEKIASKIPIQPIDEDFVSLLFFQTKQSFEHELLASNCTTPLLRPPSLASELQPLDLQIPTLVAELPSLSRMRPPQSHPEPPLSSQNALLIQTPPVCLGFELDLQTFSEDSLSKKASLSLPAPTMPSFPTLDELETSSFSDWFDLELVCTPREEGKGYLFALTLIPRFDLDTPQIRQHYTFLIDRSNSIQKDRLLATKNAVVRALEELSPNDTFNILAFDNKVEKLFPEARPVDPLSLSLAKIFLSKINLGSFFSPADFYHPLALTLPRVVQEDEIHTAILLTDGEPLGKKNALLSVIQNWTKQSLGTVSLFALCMNSDIQQPALGVAASLNRGWVVSSPTKNGLKRKLLKLMKGIHHPIAKNLSCKAISFSPQNRIELASQPSPHLYLNHPFVILGTTETADNFILFVQGRIKDRWLNIKKTVSFINAKQETFSLKKEWTLKQCTHCYEQFLSDKNPSHLEKARNLLADFDLVPLLP